MAQNKTRVLIVEDNKTFLETIKEILELRGFVVDAESTSKSLFQKIKDFKPDMLLLDIVLPDGDGFELCKKVKTSPESKNLPIILMTGFETIDIDKGFSFGADDCIFKPLDMDDVISRINKLTVKKKILIVEDDRKITEMLSLVLKDMKYELDINYDGKGLMAKLKDSKPDLFLLDINLQVPPDGLELVKEIKSQPATQHIPVIMLTGNDDISSIDKSFEYGADDYIFKPFKVPELLVKIKKYLEYRKSV